MSFRPLLALIAAVVGVALVAYHGVVDFGFVRDDFIWLLDVGPQVEDPLTILTHRPNNFFRPLANGLFALEYASFGLEPMAYHVVNLALHVWSAVWLGVLTRRLGGTWAPGFVAALLFVGLTRTTEAVTWISSLVSLLVPATLLPTLVAFDRRLETSERRFAILTGFGVVACLCSKESGVVVVPLLGLLALHRGGPRAWRARATWTELAPALALLAGYVAMQLSFLSDNTNRMELGAFDFVQGWLAGTVVHLPALVAPGWSGPIIEPRHGWIGLAVFVAAMSFILMTTQRRALRPSGLLCLTLLIMFAPFIPFLAVRFPLADRYLYLPSLVGCLALGLAFHVLRTAWPKARHVTLAAAVVTIIGGAWATRAAVQASPTLEEGRGTAAVGRWFQNHVAGADAAPGERWLLAGFPTRNSRFLAAHAAVFGGVKVDAIERLEVLPAELVPTGGDGTTIDAQGVLERFDCDHIFALGSDGAVVAIDPSSRGADKRLARALGLRWRLTRQPAMLPLCVLRF